MRRESNPERLAGCVDLHIGKRDDGLLPEHGGDASNPVYFRDKLSELLLGGITGDGHLVGDPCGRGRLLPLKTAGGRDTYVGKPDPAVDRQVVKVVEDAASDREVQQVTARQRLCLDLDTVSPMVLQDYLR